MSLQAKGLPVRSIDIETWAFRVIDRLRTASALEDVRVEMKRDWPPAAQAARQIAGHANFARGDPILWLIGLDETDGVVGASSIEFSNWHAQLNACFEGPAPAMTDLNLFSEGKLVVALAMETDRMPYVVKNPNFGKPDGGPVQFEVPWRVARGTRTARREDLLRIIASPSKVPNVEVLEANLTLARFTEMGGAIQKRYLQVQLYVVPQDNMPVVIANHKCAAFVTNAASGRVDFDWCRVSAIRLWSPRDSPTRIDDSATVSSSSTEAVLSGPGAVLFSAEGMLAGAASIDQPESTTVSGLFFLARGNEGARFDVETHKVAGVSTAEPAVVAKWRFVAPRLRA